MEKTLKVFQEPDIVTSTLFSTVDGHKSSDLAPLSSFLHHTWTFHRHMFPKGASLANSADRARFVFWYIETFANGRFPFEVLLPDDLVAWLNTPVLDLTNEISVRPAIDGDRPCYDKKFLTRYMLHVWKEYARGLDVLQASGYYHFLAWYTLHYAYSCHLNRRLVPDALIALLNRPAANASIPLTVLMLVNSKTRWPERYAEAHKLTREELVARSFESLPDPLTLRDPRLLPEFVMNYWLTKPFRDKPIVTTIEYVAARVFEKKSGVVPGFAGFTSEQYDLKHWFTASFCRALPDARIFAGYSPRETPLEGTAKGPLTLQRGTIYVHTDKATLSGLSRAGCATTLALGGSGHNVVEVDFSMPRDRIAEEFEASGRAISRSNKNLHIFHFNPEHVPECVMLQLGRIRPGDYLIGQFYWELSDIATIHECGLSLMSELWVASQYLVEVYSQHTTKPVLNMGQAVAPTLMSRSYSRTSFGLPSDAYMFLFSFDGGSVIRRKNPLGALRAFRRAFPSGREKAILVLKTRNTANAFGAKDRLHWGQVIDEAAQDERIYIIEDTYTDEQLCGLKSICDCYVSLHCSEGFGFGPAEAMALAKPVIVTNYSGVCDFCNSDNAMLVDYELTLVDAEAYPHLDDFRTYYWSTPDLDHATRAMREMYDSPEKGRRLGLAGQRTISERYSVEALRRRYQERLEDLGFRSREQYRREAHGG